MSEEDASSKPSSSPPWLQRLIADPTFTGVVPHNASNQPGQSAVAGQARAIREVAKYMGYPCMEQVNLHGIVFVPLPMDGKPAQQRPKGHTFRGKCRPFLTESRRSQALVFWLHNDFLSPGHPQHKEFKLAENALQDSEWRVHAAVESLASKANIPLHYRLFYPTPEYNHPDYCCAVILATDMRHARRMGDILLTLQNEKNNAFEEHGANFPVADRIPGPRR